MHSLLFSVFILILIACLILWGCKTRKQPNTLSRENCLQNLNDLRGLFALEIVIGHVVRYEHTILFPLGKFMICSVAFFYFVSAFGMAVSFGRKKHYLNLSFLRSKPLYLWILSLVFFLIGIAVDAICPNDLSYITPGIRWAYLLTTNWYIWELIGFYLILFCLYKFMPRFRVLFICIITLILSVAMYQKGFWEAYVASTFAFPAGLLFGEYFTQVKKFLLSCKGILVTVLLGIFGLCCLLVRTENMLSIVFMRNALCLSVIIITFYICTRFTLADNPIARFLCRYSTEIYLSQFIWIRFSESYGWNYMMRMPFVIASTLAMAVIIHPIVNMIRKILSPKQCSLI